MIWTKLNGQWTGGQRFSEATELASQGVVSDPYLLAPQVLFKNRRDIGMDGFAIATGTGKPHSWDKYLRMELNRAGTGGLDAVVMRRSMHTMFVDHPMSVRVAKNASTLEFFLQYQTNSRVDYSPGEGPEKGLRELGSSAGFAIAYMGGDTASKPVAVVALKQFGDPNSVAAPKVAMEVALALAQKGPAGGEGGYLTPATAVATEEIERRLTRIDNDNAFIISHLENVPPPWE